MNSIINQLNDLEWPDELPEGWVIIREGDWGDEGKWQSREDILKHSESGTYAQTCWSRTGDHWQGYETSFESAFEVVPYKVVVTKYKLKPVPSVAPLPATLVMAKVGQYDER
ncbi:hypothetical protein MA1A_gp02 [Pectobacterium phage MA1A]|nr:hypothetical protein MA6_gp19 [Pectobacterium phage MA6]QGH45299.1 hypothetical protein MA1A_gp02 [Pectobacterium phage MA1A]